MRSSQTHPALLPRNFSFCSSLPTRRADWSPTFCFVLLVQWPCFPWSGVCALSEVTLVLGSAPAPLQSRAPSSSSSCGDGSGGDTEARVPHPGRDFQTWGWIRAGCSLLPLPVQLQPRFAEGPGGVMLSWLCRAPSATKAGWQSSGTRKCRAFPEDELPRAGARVGSEPSLL